MKVPLSWLREYVDVPVSAKELGDLMTFSGVEVEGIEEVPGGDTVLDLEITWNRPDCLSIIGIAREVAALLGKPLRIPQVHMPDGVGAGADIQIAAPDLCARYVGQKFEGIKLGPSPEWMQSRLNLCGVRPINNVVDITNYVMLECGQPLHAFDFDLLQQGRIVVRRAAKKEPLSTLDGIARSMADDMLVIADASRPVALAGVMGGAGSEIRDSTVRVLLESAAFDPAAIRRASVKLGLATESSHRFERGVDVEGVSWASDRASGLLIELASARPVGARVDSYPGRQPLRRIVCRFDRVRRLLGVDVSDAGILSVLESLGFKTLERSTSQATLEIPSFRRDLEREADLIEEVLRMRGLDKIPEVVPMARIVPGAEDSHSTAVNRVRHQLAALGLMEVYHYSFLSPKLLDQFHVPVTCRAILPNPVSVDHAVMRPTLIPQMVESLGRNQSRQIGQAALFEVGKVFLAGPNGSVIEEERISIGLMGPVGRMTLASRKDVTNDEMYGWIKGIVEELLSLNGCGTATFAACDVAACEPGTAAEIKTTTLIGRIGLIRPDIRKEWRIQCPVAVAELTLNPILGDGTIQPVKPIPAFPSVSRDVAMSVARDVTHERILDVIRRAAPRELTAVDLFDIYRGKGVDGGRQSMAYSLRYQAEDRTLTDEEANRFHDAIKQALRKDLAAEIRES